MGQRQSLKASGAQFGVAFADRIAAELYGKDLAPGGEDAVLNLFLAEMKLEGEIMIAGGLSRPNAKVWGRAALKGLRGRFVELKHGAQAMVAGGEPGVQ